MLRCIWICGFDKGCERVTGGLICCNLFVIVYMNLVGDWTGFGWSSAGNVGSMGREC